MAEVRAKIAERLAFQQIKEIAANAGVPYGWLQQIMYGNVRSPRYEYFVRLMKSLGISSKRMIDI